MSFPYLGVQYRPAVTGRQGMVSSAHPLASVAGLRTLMEGGNAIDAAVAVASTLGATEMGLSGIGGVGWMQIYHAKSNTHICLDYQGWSPYAADRSVFKGPDQMLRGIKSLMVPGSPAGWCAALERFGTMDRASVFKHVIEICEKGHPVTVHAANIVNTYEPWLRDYPSSMEFFFPHGSPMRPGQLHKQPDLALTFRALVEGGPEVYYQGEIADKLVNFCQANGGLLTKKDLADLTVEWVDPIGIRYRDFSVYGPPPPSSAMQWLQTLKLLEGYDLAAMGHNSVDHLHTLIEVEKLAIADRVHYNVRPGAPMDLLLSDDYCSQRRKLVDPKRAASSMGRVMPTPWKSTTSNLVMPGCARVQHTLMLWMLKATPSPARKALAALAVVWLCRRPASCSMISCIGLISMPIVPTSSHPTKKSKCVSRRV